MAATAPATLPALSKRVEKTLVKVYNPNQPRDYHGRWDDAGGGGAYGSGGSGPTRREQILMDDLAAAERTLRAMSRGGVDTSDPDYIEASNNVKNTQAELNRLRNIYASQRASQMSTRPTLSQSDEAARRRALADRLVSQGQQRRMEEGLLSEIVTRGGTSGQPGRDGEPPPKPASGGLRSSLYDVTSRLARMTGHVTGIATQADRVARNIHGIASTSDYSRIGAHMNYIQHDISQIKERTSQLRSELKGLPADAKVLRRDLDRAVDRLQSQAKKLQAKLKEQAKAGLSRVRGKD